MTLQEVALTRNTAGPGKEEILKSILDNHERKRGQADLTKSEFAHKAGIHENTWASGTSWA